jgi:hypothetical protein
MPLNLTIIDPKIDHLVKTTPPGMAHWSGTGPSGTTCEMCAHYGYSAPVRNGAGDTISTKRHPKSCRRFFELMHQHGRALPSSTPSCRHFQAK